MITRDNAGHKQLLVPVALIVKNRRLYVQQRRDPRPAFNNKWEFPGGGVEWGESVEHCLWREVAEETGYKIKIQHQLSGLPTAIGRSNKVSYQVFLICFVCTIQSGVQRITDPEVKSARWCDSAQLSRLNFLPLNKKIIRSNIVLLKKYID